MSAHLPTKITVFDPNTSLMRPNIIQSNCFDPVVGYVTKMVYFPISTFLNCVNHCTATHLYAVVHRKLA